MTKEDNESRLRRALNSLIRISGILNSRTDFDRALKQILEEATHLVDAQISTILLLNEEGSLIIRESFGLPPEEIRRFFARLEKGVGSWVVKKGEPAVRTGGGRARKFALEGEDEKLVKSLLCFPLKIKGRVLGVLTLINSERPGAFSDLDLNLVSLMAVQISMDLENARLNDLLVQDGMTKLYNHKFFLQRLKEEIARARRYGQPLSVILLDIDHFKEVNQRFGEEAGDRVLADLTRVLEESVRKTDLLARYAGEEFGLILPNTSGDGASAIGNCISNIVENSEFYHGSNRLKIRMSYGAATLCDTIKDDKQFIRAANENLQRHKLDRETPPAAETVGPAAASRAETPVREE